MVNMVNVESSNIIAIGYENTDLYVEYLSGTYIYHSVPQEVYDRLMAAPSKGIFMNMEIKHTYSYEKVK